MGRAFQPAFLPVYGSGAPGGTVPHSAVYFDTSAVPYTPYIYHSGAWHSFGGGAAGGNATQLQGIAISSTPPTDGQVLKYVAAVPDWEPATIAASGPTIIQDVVASNASLATGIVVTAPTQNNLLLAFCFSTGSQNVAGAGWLTLFNGTSGTYDTAIFYKIAGAGESTIQTPTSVASSGEISFYEIHNGAISVGSETVSFSSAAPTVAVECTKASMIAVGAVADNSGATTATFTNATLGQHAGAPRSINSFNNTGPAQGSTTITANLSASVNGAMAVVAIG